MPSYGMRPHQTERRSRHAELPESVVIRTAWLYSTFGNNFVKTMLRLGREKESLGVIFDQIGTPTYARDLAVAIFAVLTQDFVPGIYHFSNEPSHGTTLPKPSTTVASPPARYARSIRKNIPHRQLFGLDIPCSTRPKSKRLITSTFPIGKTR